MPEIQDNLPKKHAGGRPLKFKSVIELQQKIDEYFESIKKPIDDGETIRFEPATITGLALALDTSRETLCNYEDRDEFFDIIKRAKLRVENYVEKQLYAGKNVAGPIFVLKNLGWKDERQVKTDDVTPPENKLLNDMEMARRIGFILRAGLEAAKKIDKQKPRTIEHEPNE